ncbi:hypothetical protein TUBRATIS_20170, partial [Tubulinosema ratisbonensis]
MFGWLLAAISTWFNPSQKKCASISQDVNTMVGKFDLKWNRLKLERSAFFLGHCVYGSKDPRMNLLSDEVDKLFLILEDREKLCKNVIQTVLIQCNELIKRDDDEKLANEIKEIVECLDKILILDNCADNLDYEYLFKDDMKNQEEIFCLACNEQLHEAKQCPLYIHVQFPSFDDPLPPKLCSELIQKACFCKIMRKLFPFDYKNFEDFKFEMTSEPFRIHANRGEDVITKQPSTIYRKEAIRVPKPTENATCFEPNQTEEAFPIKDNDKQEECIKTKLNSEECSFNLINYKMIKLDMIPGLDTTLNEEKTESEFVPDFESNPHFDENDRRFDLNPNLQKNMKQEDINIIDEKYIQQIKNLESIKKKEQSENDDFIEPIADLRIDKGIDLELEGCLLTKPNMLQPLQVKEEELQGAYGLNKCHCMIIEETEDEETEEYETEEEETELVYYTSGVVGNYYYDIYNNPLPTIYEESGEENESQPEEEINSSDSVNGLINWQQKSKPLPGVKSKFDSHENEKF